ncbi:DUF5671 domain-containing protein [Paracoccus shanxieyensis]|uniref:DUF5671 domain-containing protein n=1 Tax=Paracoccus shanxieyensis TaxID=2675752 RepID=A0A6L6J212_9RHOB|nr:DUF5671 domain-containing protein [Paracoccus shanxieyensis]MTH65868.1 hypothetical protein [Paracoccus shanxieyensis]MTH89223.1 hypothetical protein [Paracoccus shanxieyensis]
MKPAEQLSQFVRQSLMQGTPPDAILAALEQAGWSRPEIDEAIAGWGVTPGLPPVPRPRPYASAQEALLYGLLFVSLGVISWHLCQLGVALIDYLVPDVADYPTAPGSAERWSIAALIAFGPVFLLLNRRVARLGRDDAGRRRSLVRKWFASLTLMVAALVLLADAIWVIYTFLNGDLTLRFILKAGLVAAITGLVLAYYRDEMNG